MLKSCGDRLHPCLTPPPILNQSVPPLLVRIPQIPDHYTMIENTEDDTCLYGSTCQRWAIHGIAGFIKSDNIVFFLILSPQYTVGIRCVSRGWLWGLDPPGFCQHFAKSAYFGQFCPFFSCSAPGELPATVLKISAYASGYSPLHSDLNHGISFLKIVWKTVLTLWLLSSVNNNNLFISCCRPK